MSWLSDLKIREPRWMQSFIATSTVPAEMAGDGWVRRVVGGAARLPQRCMPCILSWVPNPAPKECVGHASIQLPATSLDQPERPPVA